MKRSTMHLHERCLTATTQVWVCLQQCSCAGMLLHACQDSGTRCAMQVPLPLATVSEVMQQVIVSSSRPSSNSLSSSSSVCVSLLAVVTGLTPPADVCFSQRFHCPSCGQLADALTTQHSLPCCNIPKTDWLKEDITGRWVCTCGKQHVVSGSATL